MKLRHSVFLKITKVVSGGEVLLSLYNTDKNQYYSASKIDILTIVSLVLSKSPTDYSSEMLRLRPVICRQEIYFQLRKTSCMI